MNQNFIFVAGLHRSGTSLLHDMIRAHPEVSGLSNTGVPEDEGQHLQSIYKPAAAYGGPGNFALNKDAYMDERHELATEHSAEAIMRQWAPYYDPASSYYIEKSPPNLIRTRFLQKLFPKSRFVVILRHPLAVSYATAKWAPKSIRHLIQHTLKAYEIFRQDLPYLNHVYVLRYEDLVSKPAEMTRVFEFLELEPIPNRQRLQTDINDKYFSMWREDRKRLRDRLAFPVSPWLEWRANRFGYSLREYNKLLPSRVLGAHTAGVA